MNPCSGYVSNLKSKQLLWLDFSRLDIDPNYLYFCLIMPRTRNSGMYNSGALMRAICFMQLYLILEHEHPRFSLSIRNFCAFSPASMLYYWLRQLQAFFSFKRDQNFHTYSLFSCRYRFTLLLLSHYHYHPLLLYRYSQFSELGILILLSPHFLLLRFLILSIVWFFAHDILHSHT